VNAFPVFIRFKEGRVHLACFFPMPFFRSARFVLVGAAKVVRDMHWRLRFEALNEPPNHVGYFHATYRDHPHPQPGKDLILLDTRRTENAGEWSGSFIGTSFIFSHAANLNTLEGDPRFYFD